MEPCGSVANGIPPSDTEARFRWPAAEALVPSVVAQNFVKGLSEPPPELLSVLGGAVKSAECRQTAKKEDVSIELVEPVPLGQLGIWQEELRAQLSQAADDAVRNRADAVELLPGGVHLGAAAPLKERTVIVDTDAISFLFKGDTRSNAFKELLKEQDRKMISFQTVAELDAWILLRHFSTARIRRLEELLQEFEVIWPDRRTCLLWAQLMDHGRTHGRPVGAQDGWVAAIALRQGARICTGNQKDYDFLPGVHFLTPPIKAESKEARAASGQAGAAPQQRGAASKPAVQRGLGLGQAEGRRLTSRSPWSLSGPRTMAAAGIALAGGLVAASLMRRGRR